MNNMYITPCNPIKCDFYVYGELCGKESECQPFIDYRALKSKMQSERKREQELKEYTIKGYKMGGRY